EQSDGVQPIAAATAQELVLAPGAFEDSAGHSHFGEHRGTVLGPARAAARAVLPGDFVLPGGARFQRRYAEHVDLEDSLGNRSRIGGRDESHLVGAARAESAVFKRLRGMAHT